jgi:hypothetical protein
MRAALLLLPLALAACGSNNPRYAQCAAQVNADPQIRDLTQKYAGASSADQMMQFDPTPLRQEKMKACLQGYPTTSGVEPVRHPRYTIDLF